MPISSSTIHSLAGAFSGFASCFAVQPLDVLKTRLQQPILIQPSLAFPPGPSLIATPSVAWISKSIYEEQGWAGFWRGTVPTLVRNVPGTSLYFLTLDYCRSFLSYVFPTSSPSLMNMTAGAFARGWVGLIMMPASVIKTRFESSMYHYTSVWGALRGICAKEGVKGLFAGFGVTAMRDVPFAGIYLMCYENSKEKLRENYWPNWVNQCVSASLAGVVATVVTQPFDLVKTKVQVAPTKYPSSWFAAKELYRMEGLKGFLSGLGPRLARKPLHALITWTVYEESVKALRTFNEQPT